jgi:hypothetical protein
MRRQRLVDLESQMPCDGFDPAGRAVVITGRINQPWMLTGPLCDMEAARQWGAANNINSVV